VASFPGWQLRTAVFDSPARARLGPDAADELQLPVLCASVETAIIDSWLVLQAGIFRDSQPVGAGELISKK